jgi:hypothetical protein
MPGFDSGSDMNQHTGASSAVGRTACHLDRLYDRMPSHKALVCFCQHILLGNLPAARDGKP